MKRRAIRLARKEGIREASAKTGISESYVASLLDSRCRVHGFEGKQTRAELAEVGLAPHPAKEPCLGWIKSRAA